MHFLVIARDGEDPAASLRRQAARERHLEAARSYFRSGQWLDAAALLDDAGEMVGSVILSQFASRAQLDDWLSVEPYVTGEVWKSIEVVPVKVPAPFSKLHDFRRMDFAFRVDSGPFAVCRLGPQEPFPAWVDTSGWYSVTKTRNELSIVCPAASVPNSIRAERDWAMLVLDRPIPFSHTGVCAGFSSVLAAADVPVFVVSTYDSDTVLVPVPMMVRAIEVLEAAGARKRGEPR